MRHAMPAFALLVGLSLSAAACLWDRDTPAEEALGLPEVVAVLTGRFERNPPLYYEMRLARVTLHLQSQPGDYAWGKFVHNDRSLHNSETFQRRSAESEIRCKVEDAAIMRYVPDGPRSANSGDCLPFLKKVFYGEIPNLISKRGDGRTRWRIGGGWSRRACGNRRSKSRRRICLRRRYRRSGPAGARLGRWHGLRRRILVGASAQWRLHGARTTLSRRGYRVGRAHREGLPLPPRATSVRVRSRFLRSMVPLSLVPAEQPNI